MDFNDCLRALKKYIFLIAAITFIAAVSAWAVSQYAIERVYESSATIIMSGTNTKDYGETTCEYSVLLDKNLIKVFNNIAESDTIAENIIKSMDLKYTVKEVRKLINIDVEEETGIIKISVRTNNAGLSKNIVQEFIKSLKEQSQIFVSKLYIHTIDAPNLKKKPVSPNILLNTLLSIAGGILTGILLAILLSAKNLNKANISVLNKIPSLFVIGNMPRLKGNRIKSGQPLYENNNKIVESIKIIRTNLQYLMKRDAIKKILITSPSISEGKTTMAINLAASMSQMNKRVLLIECNFQNPIFYKIFKNDMADSSYHKVNGYMVKSVQSLGVDIVTDAMIPRDQTNINYSLLQSMIEAMEQNYDLVIIDSPPIITNADTMILAEIIKNVILVADYRRLTYPILEKGISSLNKIDAKILGIIVNRVPLAKVY